MSMGMDSKPAFEAALDLLELVSFKAELTKMGISTFSDLAFCTPAGSGDKDSVGFEVVLTSKLCNEEPKQWALPRFRRLYHQAYAQASRDLEETAAKDPAAKVHMHPSDRQERTDKLRTRITGFQLVAENLPSNALVDRFTTMLSKSAVKYVRWEHCTDRASEMLDEPEIKTLRVVDNTLLMQDVAKEKITNISGELLWSLALRRRCAAADIAGICRFEAMDLWSNVMLQHLLMAPPDGFRRVSWSQLKAADEQLFVYVASACEKGVKAAANEPETKFEEAWKKGIYDLSVRQLLSFLQGSSSSSSLDGPSSVMSTALVQTGAGRDRRAQASAEDKDYRKMKHQLKEATEQLAKQRRLSDWSGTWNAKGGKKGKGNGKKGDGKQQGGKGVLQGHPNRTKDGQPICYKFHSPGGCPMAAAGASCYRGQHVCPKCGGPHTLETCGKQS